MGSRNCLITLRVYTQTGSAILFGDGILDFGDGTTQVTPTIENTFLPEVGPNIGFVEFNIEHTYPAFGSYLVTYLEPNRSHGIVNFENSVGTRFYMESFFTIKSAADPYRSPIFLTVPIFRSESNRTYSESLVAVDSSGYRLIYFFSTPQRGVGLAVNNYILPESYSINNYNGLMTWDGKFQAAGAVGQFLFAAKVCQYENDILIGYVVRDIEVTLEDIPSRSWITDTKALDANNRLVVYPGEEDSVKILFSHQGFSGEGEVNVVTELSSVPGVVNYLTYDSTYLDDESQVVKVKVMNLKFNSLPEIDRDFPYVITVRGTVAKRSKDIVYLLYTRDVDDSDLPDPPVVVFALPDPIQQIEPATFPNPASGTLIVGIVDRATIYTMQGTKVKEIVSPETSILVYDLSPGFYILMTERSGRSPESQRIAVVR